MEVERQLEENEDVYARMVVMVVMMMRMMMVSTIRNPNQEASKRNECESAHDFSQNSLLITVVEQLLNLHLQLQLQLARRPRKNQAESQSTFFPPIRGRHSSAGSPLRCAPHRPHFRKHSENYVNTALAPSAPPRFFLLPYLARQFTLTTVAVQLRFSEIKSAIAQDAASLYHTTLSEGYRNACLY